MTTGTIMVDGLFSSRFAIHVFFAHINDSLSKVTNTGRHGTTTKKNTLNRNKNATHFLPHANESFR